ncbi:MAG: adenosylmethionine--8-amino-7-oxononanoate transaminase [Nitrospirae bacterium]|nr:adenosylmethionine--8-amino-7-oxononanoate transaminase [Nitrospirota bacterium]
MTNHKEADPDRLAALDHAHLWHPFTQMREWAAEPPLIITEGEGVKVRDVEGRWYWDGVSSLWVNLHGHRKTEIDRAIVAQLSQIAHSTLLGCSSPPAILLAERLVALAPPGLTKVFYSDNGSTAVEVALKMALQYWQQMTPAHPRKTKILAFSLAYHGDTVGAVSVGGIDVFHARFAPYLFPTFKANPPYCYRCHLGLTYPSCETACLTDLEEALRRHHDEIAALIVEPLMQAAAGMLAAPAGYLRRLRDLCTRYNVLMIADEVATGFGRTGTMFACEQEGVTPDLMAVAKGLTGGYLPLAATLATQAVYDAFLGEYPEFRTFFHGHSYTGNALACAAALANLDVFLHERVIDGLAPKLAGLRNALAPLAAHPHVGDIRQCGLMVGVELVQDAETKTRFPTASRIGWTVSREARALGLLTRPLGDVLVLVPPLAATPDELTVMVDILHQAIVNTLGGRRDSPAVLPSRSDTVEHGR